MSTDPIMPPTSDTHILLLTGHPGVGKTTVIAAAVDQLMGQRVAGFITEELRDGNGKRRGFQAVTFDGRRRVIAHAKRKGPPSVGKYGVDVAAIDALVGTALVGDVVTAADAVLIDEIGKMECFSPRFVAAVRSLLDGPRPLVATIAQRGGGLIAEVKTHPGAELWEVTPAYRDGMPEAIADWVMERLQPT